jgi:hypothetical protein
VRVVEPGHVYELEEVDVRGPKYTQKLYFVRRRDERGELLSQSSPGILTQELLRVAIDRTLYLYAEAPCDEDTKILEHLRAALALYESRAARRTIEKLSKVEAARPCGKCGHILCLHSPEERVRPPVSNTALDRLKEALGDGS